MSNTIITAGKIKRLGTVLGMGLCWEWDCVGNGPGNVGNRILLCYEGLGGGLAR